MRKSSIFGNTLVANNKIKKITIKPNFNNNIEFCLTVNIKLSGESVNTSIKIVKQKDIEKKFGIYNETTWYKKGLSYDKAKQAMTEDNNYNNVLSAIRKGLKDEVILDTHKGDMFGYLDTTGILDKYKEQYLSLIRESTEEEFRKVEATHYYMVKLNELRYTSEEQEEERNKIYEELKPLHEKAFGRPIGSLASVITWIKEMEAEERFLSYARSRP